MSTEQGKHNFVQVEWRGHWLLVPADWSSNLIAAGMTVANIGTPMAPAAPNLIEQVNQAALAA